MTELERAVSDFDLRAFLTEQSSAGTSLGEGDFTVSLEKAALKMSRYSLPREFAWVLKLVQVAVSLHCSALRVIQTRTSSTFFFETDSPRLLATVQELVPAILHITLESDRLTDCLGAALRLLVEGSHSSFLMQIARGDGPVEALYAGVHFSEMSENGRRRVKQGWTSPLCLQIHHVPHTDRNRLLYRFIPFKDQALPLALELERHAYVSPIPILLDGRRLDGIFRSGALKWTSRKRPILTAGIRLPIETTLAWQICEGFDDQVFQIDLQAATLPPADTPSPIRGAYVLMSLESCRNRYEVLERARRTHICWVKDGVVVEEETLEILTPVLGLHMYISAGGLTTDLTGFHLVRNFEFKKRRQTLLKEVKSVLLQEQVNTHQLFRVEEPVQPSQSDDLFTERLKALRKRWGKVKDVVEDQSSYWDKMAITRGYKNALHTLIRELESDGADPALGTIKRKVRAENSLLSPDTESRFVWVPPEER